MFAKFVDIADHCQRLRNYFSMFNIVIALGSPEMRRNKNMMKKVPDKVKAKLVDLEGLMDPSKNMKKYRELVAASPDLPFVPFLPLHLKDLTFVNEVKTKSGENVVNYDKLRMVGKCIASLVMTRFYNLNWNSALQAYIKFSVEPARPPVVAAATAAAAKTVSKPKSSGGGVIGTVRKAARAIRDGLSANDSANNVSSSSEVDLAAPPLSGGPAAPAAAGAAATAPAGNRSSVSAPAAADGGSAARRVSILTTLIQEPSANTSSVSASAVLASADSPQARGRTSSVSSYSARTSPTPMKRTISMDSLRKLGTNLMSKHSGKPSNTSLSPNIPSNLTFPGQPLRRRTASFSLEMLPSPNDPLLNTSDGPEPFASAIGPEGPWATDDMPGNRRMSFNERIQMRRDSTISSMSSSSACLDPPLPPAVIPPTRAAEPETATQAMARQIVNRNRSDSLNRASASMPHLYKTRVQDPPELINATALDSSSLTSKAQLLAGNRHVPDGIVVTVADSSLSMMENASALGDSMMVLGVNSPKDRINSPKTVAYPVSPGSPCLPEASMMVASANTTVVSHDTSAASERRAVSFSAARIEQALATAKKNRGSYDQALQDEPGSSPSASPPRSPGTALPPHLKDAKLHRPSVDSVSSGSTDPDDQLDVTDTSTASAAAGRFSPTPRAKRAKLHPYPRSTPGGRSRARPSISQEYAASGSAAAAAAAAVAAVPFQLPAAEMQPQNDRHAVMNPPSSSAMAAATATTVMQPPARPQSPASARFPFSRSNSSSLLQESII